MNGVQLDDLGHVPQAALEMQIIGASTFEAAVPPCLLVLHGEEFPPALCTQNKTPFAGFRDWEQGWQDQSETHQPFVMA